MGEISPAFALYSWQCVRNETFAGDENAMYSSVHWSLQAILASQSSNRPFFDNVEPDLDEFLQKYKFNLTGLMRKVWLYYT